MAGRGQPLLDKLLQYRQYSSGLYCSEDFKTFLNSIFTLRPIIEMHSSYHTYISIVLVA